MSDDHGPPGTPHTSTWRAPDLAEIAEDGVALAILGPGGADALELTVLREPPSEAGRELLARAVLWAPEEHARRERAAG